MEQDFSQLTTDRVKAVANTFRQSEEMEARASDRTFMRDASPVARLGIGHYLISRAAVAELARRERGK